MVADAEDSSGRMLLSLLCAAFNSSTLDKPNLCHSQSIVLALVEADNTNVCALR